MKNRLTIGKLAKQAGINLETIRYYQRIGLIEQPLKPENGYRIYPQSTLNRLQFIQRAKQLGFSLAEIKQLLQLEEDTCEHTRKLAEQKQQLIKQKIADLQTLANTLEQYIQACYCSDDHQDCPIIKAFLS